MSAPALSTQEVRWRVPVALAVTLFVNYLDRNNLALALPRIAQDFGWSDRQIGSNGEVLLAAFFLSYALSNMLLSPLAERFGPKRSVILAIAAFSLFTILSAPLGQSLTALVILRLLLGLGEGVHIPMLSAITSQWFPPSERSRANAIWGAGILVATATAPLMIVPLISTIGWRPAFAVLGVVGMVLSIPLVWVLVHDRPSGSAGVSAAELAYIQGGRDRVAQEPLRLDSGPEPDAQRPHYTRDRRFWLVVLGGILNAFCAFGLLSWLPTYFNRAKGIDFEQLGWPLALVFAAGIIGILLMAYLGDKLQRRLQLAGAGFLMAGLMVYVAATSGELGWVVLCFAIAVFCQSAYGAQEYAIVQCLLPSDRVGAGTGLYNGLSILLGGVGGSLIPGSIVAATGSFDAGILSIVAGALLASLVLFWLSTVMRY
ncbi:MAG TPA: MFS transporter [Chroococcidiopsis sp.]